MKESKQKVTDMLRHAGFAEAADAAERELPDPVELEQAIEFGSKHGVTRDALISEMGGSPCSRPGPAQDLPRPGPRSGRTQAEGTTMCLTSAM